MLSTAVLRGRGLLPNSSKVINEAFLFDSSSIWGICSTESLLNVGTSSGGTWCSPVDAVLQTQTATRRIHTWWSSSALAKLHQTTLTVLYGFILNSNTDRANSNPFNTFCKKKVEWRLKNVLEEWFNDELGTWVPLTNIFWRLKKVQHINYLVDKVRYCFLFV